MRKPEIVAFEPFGVHNTEGAKERPWKKQRTVVMMPAGHMVPTRAAFSWWNLAFPPNDASMKTDQPTKLLAEGYEVGAAYSATIEAILAHPMLRQFEYLLTIEMDNVTPPDSALKLMKAMDEHPEMDCVSALYWTKGEDGYPQIWGDPNEHGLDFRPQEPREACVQECQGVGMGFALWRLSMFKDERLPRPLFETVASEEGTGSQDLMFWRNARPLGFRCAVDTSCVVGHIDYAGQFGRRGIVW